MTVEAHELRSIWFINGAHCRAHLSLHRGSSWCNHKRDVFMNGALTDECELTTAEEQRERALSSPIPTRGDIHHSDGPRLVLPWLVFLRTVTEKHSKSPRTWICTDSFYMLVVFRVRVYQRCWWLVLRWDCDKRNQRGRHRCPLWFLLWTLICSNTAKMALENANTC